MQINDRRLKRTNSSVQKRLPPRVVMIGAVMSGAVLILTANPAYAGWRNGLARAVLPALIRRAFVQPLSPPATGAAAQMMPSAAAPRVRQTPAMLASPQRSPVPSPAVAQAFQQGLAGRYSYDQLVSANIFESDLLHGSVLKRQGTVKYIILHSTETASPADARRVILSWNNRGLRHPGSQFVVDRDGTICSTTNPDMVTIHIDTNKAIAGYSNDNSVGIEIVRSGKQQYTPSQLDSVTALVSYLQSHYGIPDSNVTTHHHVQPSDRSDPVNFDMLAFESDKAALRSCQIADAGHILSIMPKPAPDFRLRRN